MTQTSLTIKNLPVDLNKAYPFQDFWNFSQHPQVLVLMQTAGEIRTFKRSWLITENGGRF